MKKILIAVTITFIFSLNVGAEPIFSPVTGHYYERIDFPEGTTWDSEWDASKAQAEQMIFMGISGHLATITSEEENWWIINNLGGEQTLDHWLGGYQDENNEWRWITGESWSYTNWFPGEPSSGADSVLQFDDAETDPPVPGYWNDLSPSSFEDGFIVEWDILTVTSPNGGEELFAGTIYEITWSSDDGIESVKIEYSVNNGTGWTEIVAITDNDGSFDWEVPATSSEDCLVRIADINSAAFDVSDAVFSIIGNQPPVADAGTYDPVFDTVILDSSSCSDPDGTIEHYAWRLHHMELGGDIFVEGGSPTVSGLVKGYYEVSLIITDDEGAIGQDNTVLPVAGPCEGLDQCLNDLTQCRGGAEQCNTNLTRCNDDLKQLSRDLTACNENLGKCEDNLSGCQTASEQCNDELSQAMTNLEMCYANVTQLQEELDQTKTELEQALEDLAVATADTDGDGVRDATDTCPGTLSGAAVDLVGCSLSQFCALISTQHSSVSAACNNADWMNNEPVGNPKDCHARQGSCVPR